MTKKDLFYLVSMSLIFSLIQIRKAGSLGDHAQDGSGGAAGFIKSPLPLANGLLPGTQLFGHLGLGHLKMPPQGHDFSFIPIFIHSQEV